MWLGSDRALPGSLPLALLAALLEGLVAAAKPSITSLDLR